MKGMSTNASTGGESVSLLDSSEKEVEPEKEKTLLEVDTQPLGVDLNSSCTPQLSPASSSISFLSDQTPRKRPAAEEAQGLNLKKRSRTRAVKGSDFISDDILVTMTLPCHDNVRLF